MVQGLVTAVWWEGPYFHPKEFQEGEITPDLITDLRMAKPDRVTPKCNAAAALASSSEVLPSVRRCVTVCDTAWVTRAAVIGVYFGATQHCTVHLKQEDHTAQQGLAVLFTA